MSIKCIQYFKLFNIKVYNSNVVSYDLRSIYKFPVTISSGEAVSFQKQIGKLPSPTRRLDKWINPIQ